MGEDAGNTKSDSERENDEVEKFSDLFVRMARVRKRTCGEYGWLGSMAPYFFSGIFLCFAFKHVQFICVLLVYSTFTYASVSRYTS